MRYYAYAIFHRSCNDEAIASSCLKVATASSVCVSVCLLDTTVSRTKTAEPIEVPFGVRTANSGRPIGARNYVLRGGVEIPPTARRTCSFGVIFGHVQSRRDRSIDELTCCSISNILISKFQQPLFLS